MLLWEADPACKLEVGAITETLPASEDMMSEDEALRVETEAAPVETMEHLSVNKESAQAAPQAT